MSAMLDICAVMLKAPLSCGAMQQTEVQTQLDHVNVL